MKFLLQLGFSLEFSEVLLLNNIRETLLSLIVENSQNTKEDGKNAIIFYQRLYYLLSDWETINQATKDSRKPTIQAFFADFYGEELVVDDFGTS